MIEEYVGRDASSVFRMFHDPKILKNRQSKKQVFIFLDTEGKEIKSEVSNKVQNVITPAKLLALEIMSTFPFPAFGTQCEEFTKL